MMDPAEHASLNQHPAALSPRLRALLESRRPGHGLAREFYLDEELYQLELERIWRRGWLFAGHSCEAPRPGDYFTWDVAGDPILVIRGDDGRLRAFHNVCRHRGSLVACEPAGHAGKLVCPYHGWVYGRDGRLLACRGMHEEIDRSALGLKEVQCRDLEGLVFVSLVREPLDFDSAERELAPALRPQGFRRARVAKVVDYQVRANWKVVWENNRECYHCVSNHPQYVKANFDHYNQDDANERTKEALARAAARSEAKWKASGLAASHKEAGMTVFPGECWWSANRTPLVDGFLSETMDGRQAAPLMGDYTEPDVGTLRIRALPNFWNHSSCDHGVSTRLEPAGPALTRIRVTWLVAEGAVEGRDYRLEDLLPFWQLTSEQDWAICERVQRGVSSSGYEPGPFSTYKEYNVEGLVRWYLKDMGGGEG